MTRRELTEDSSAPELWAEIYLLREALRGPDGFATWKDAAINERVRRVRAEAALRTAHPTKDAGELPPLPEHVGYLGSQRDAIRPYAYSADQMRAYALAARTSAAVPSQELDGGFHGAYGDGYDAGFEAGKLAAPSQEAGDDAARDVLAERRRQISAEGWTPEHDDEHGAGSMAFAAAAYAVHANAGGPRLSTLLWNRTGWGRDWWKPKDARRDLIRAGALIRAEIERIDRAAMAATTSTPGEQA